MDLPFQDFGIALLIGALVGIDREKRKASGDPVGIGGLRTFILLAEAGAVAAWLATQMQSAWVFGIAGAGVAGLLIAGYLVHARTHADHGLTTEVAALVVFLLGGMVLSGQRELAVATAVATSAVLAYKHPLHGLVAKLSQDDVYAGLKLLIATFIVLPLLPDRALDPWGAINPYRLWWLVILIAGLSLVGYVAARWLGEQRGTALAGLFGGLVSSTAVALAFAKRSAAERHVAGLPDALACGLLLSWVAMCGRIVVIVAAVNADLLGGVAVPMAAMGGLSAAAAAGFFLRSRNATIVVPRENLPLTNPFSLASAAKFALLFAAVLLLVKLVQTHMPGEGLYALAALAGLTDVDAIALSMADYAREGEARVAVVSIAVAALSNTLVKCGLVAALGTRELRGRMVPATIAVAAAGAAAVLFV